MPKKTKKEKLLALKHRSHLPPVTSSFSPPVTHHASPNPTQYSLSLSATTHPLASPAASVDFRAMKTDLAKTLIFTTGILVSEFLLAGILLNK